MAELKFYQDKKKRWRWKITASNGKIVGASSQSFCSIYEAEQNYKRLKAYIKQFNK